MKHFYFGRRTLFSLSLLSALLTASAGNIPQYSVAKGDASAKYAEFSDGTVIPCSWSTGTYALLPNGTTNPNVTTAQGYPIGFDFHFGGRTVNQFIPSNTGVIYLGEDVVTYGDGCFCLSMSPIMHGLKAGQISYKVIGDAGNRILILQWKEATLNTSSGYVGKYSLQYRLYEKDGKIEMAFKELETPGSNNGFDTSIHGWDGRDAVVLTAAGLDRRMSVSDKFSADMLTPSTYVKWDADDYDNGYSPVFIFTPESDTTPPACAPTELEVIQNGENLDISCVRGSDADATVILISTEPFTEADMPVDGTTFQASYVDVNGKQWHPTQIGNAKPLSYINDTEISTVFNGVESGKTYYIRAVSANGYPAYNRSEVAEVAFTASQAAPTSFMALPKGPESILLNCVAADPVIVAATTERVPGYSMGYYGLFGTPEADAAAGDDIEGGGHVVYAGPAGEFNIQTQANAMTYFRAWTVRDGRLSSTTADCAAAPSVSFPFAPSIENYPQGESIRGWQTDPAEENVYVPLSRNSGTENALRTVSSNGARRVLLTPEMPLDRPMKVMFDWAMETVREAGSSEDSGSVELPRGNMPGVFGSGSLDVIINGTTYRSTNTYDGTMTLFAAGEYVEGTSTFVPFTAEIPQGEGTGRIEISFAGDAANTSILYLRNISIEALGEAPVAPSEAPVALTVDEDRDGFLHVNCTKGGDAAYTMVLVSESPVTSADLPADGMTLTVGAKSGNATVLYWGSDEDIICATTADLLVSDFDKTYYVAAASASSAPLYNRTDITQTEYRTMPDFSAPSDLAGVYDSEANAIDITATRQENAVSTLILVSPATFDGIPEDGRDYTEGETLGNATVAYHGTDSGIAVHHVLSDVPQTVTVTAYSRNPRGWYSALNRSVEVPIINVGVESIVIDGNLSEAEIYNVAGVRLHVSELSELPAGIYVVNSKKIVIR